METNLPTPTTARVELLINQRVPHNFPGFQLFQTVPGLLGWKKKPRAVGIWTTKHEDKRIKSEGTTNKHGDAVNKRGDIQGLSLKRRMGSLSLQLGPEVPSFVLVLPWHCHDGLTHGAMKGAPLTSTQQQHITWVVMKLTLDRWV